MTIKHAPGWYGLRDLHIVRTNAHGDAGWDWLVTDDPVLAADLATKAKHGGTRDLRYEAVIAVHNTLRDAVRYHRAV